MKKGRWLFLVIDICNKVFKKYVANPYPLYFCQFMVEMLTKEITNMNFNIPLK
jgi:hypothetical protein